MLVAGSLWAGPLQPLVGFSWLRNGIVFTVMFLMALPIRASTIVRNVRRPWPALLATAVNFGLVPVLVWLVSGWLPADLVTGFLVVGATPCTLASATVWTARAGGNETAALMTTLITNGLCFLVTPLLLGLLIGQVADFQPAAMTGKLLALVLLPTALAQVARCWPALARFVEGHRKSLSVVAQVGVLAMVLIGNVSNSHRFVTGDPGPLSDWLVAGALAAVVHLAAVAAGYTLARVARMDRANRIAVAIAGSQKTLMVGLLLCLWLDVSPLPLIAWHVVQLVADTLLADWFRRRQAACERSDKGGFAPGPKRPCQQAEQNDRAGPGSDGR